MQSIFKACSYRTKHMTQIQTPLKPLIDHRTALIIVFQCRSPKKSRRYMPDDANKVGHATGSASREHSFLKLRHRLRIQECWVKGRSAMALMFHDMSLVPIRHK